MGVNNIAPRTFNSTGAQSVCRANAPDKEKLIQSQFLTGCQVEYIHGTGESFVRGSLNALPTVGNPSSTENQDIFYLESDVDAISDINLSISLDMSAITGNVENETINGNNPLQPTGQPNGRVGPNSADTKNAPKTSTITKDFLLSMIHKIEIRVGGLTVQTILPEEIFMRNLTEYDAGNIDEWLTNGVSAVNKDDFNFAPRGDRPLGLAMAPITDGSDQMRKIRLVDSEITSMLKINRGNNIMIVQDGTRYTWSLSIPFIGRSNNMQNCFLQSGAVTNSITVVVFYNAAFPSQHTGSKQFDFFTVSNPANAPLVTAHARGVYSLIRDLDMDLDATEPHAITDPGSKFRNTYRSWLTVRSHTFTKTETDFVQANIINRIVTASQSVSREIGTGEIIVPDSDVTPRNGVSNISSEYSLANTQFGRYNDLPLPFYGKPANATSTNPGGVEKYISHINKQTIPITVDLANFDIIASHLLIAAFAPVHNSDGSVSVPPLELDFFNTCSNIQQGASFEPQLNYSTMSNFFAAEGTDPDPNKAEAGKFGQQTCILPFVSGESLSFTGYSLGSKSKCMGPFGCSIRGVLDNWLDSIEIRIGSDTTGRLPASSLLKTGEEFGLSSAGGAPIYVIPLADVPFSTAGIPMARVGTKQVILHIDQRYGIRKGPFTEANGSYDASNSASNSTTPSILSLKSWAPITKVSVVGVGTRVQTTVGGGTSFAS